MIALRSFLFCLVLAVSPSAFTWNEFGHMLVAELALQKLAPKLQRKLEAQAFSLVKQQDAETRLYLMRTYPDSSAFAQLAVFADEYKQMPLAELYGRFGQRLPENFLNIAGDNTAKWHYKNQAYLPPTVSQPPNIDTAALVNEGIAPPDIQPKNIAARTVNQCDLSESVDVTWAIENTQQAFRLASSAEEQVLALAFLVHFVGDAHQPMHGISRVDKDCTSDRGGNGFCVVYRGSSLSCETNLHAFWDAGIGFFDSFDRINDARDFVARVEVNAEQANNLEPDAWLSEGMRHARFIYSIKEGSGGDSYYIKEGQIIAYERIALAAERLARILNTLY